MAWKRGTRADGLLGGFLIFVLPALILVAAAAFWWTNLGLDDAFEMDAPRIEASPPGG